MFARLRGEMADDTDELTGAPYGDVLMVGVADLGEKEALLAADGDAYFTIAHYDGYPAVLVRLDRADADGAPRAAPRRLDAGRSQAGAQGLRGHGRHRRRCVRNSQ